MKTLINSDKKKAAKKKGQARKTDPVRLAEAFPVIL